MFIPYDPDAQRPSITFSPPDPRYGAVWRLPDERFHPDGGLLPTGKYCDKNGRIVSDEFTPEAMRADEV